MIKLANRHEQATRRITTPHGPPPLTLFLRCGFVVRGVRTRAGMGVESPTGPRPLACFPPAAIAGASSRP